MLGPPLESSRFPLTVPRALHGNGCPGRFDVTQRGPFLDDDVFLHGAMWMGRLAIMPALAYSS
jgi:hypothetical protein